LFYPSELLNAACKSLQISPAPCCTSELRCVTIRLHNAGKRNFHTAAQAPNVKKIQWGTVERKKLLLETRSLYHPLVIAYIEMNLFVGNLFQAHSLMQSYHPTQPLKQENQNQTSKIKIKNQKSKSKSKSKIKNQK